MATAPRGYTRKESNQAKQAIATGLRVATVVLDGSDPEHTVEIMRLGAASKVSFQATGDLAGTVEFSISGLGWFGSTAIPGSNAPGSYNTHNVDGIRVTRSSGSGQLFVVVT